MEWQRDAEREKTLREERKERQRKGKGLWRGGALGGWNESYALSRASS